MYRWFIACKYLFSRITTFAALVVVAASVSLLIIIVSVMEGFRSELQARIRGTSSDLKVESTNYIGLREPDRVADAVAKLPGVRATAPYVETLVFCRPESARFGPGDVEHRFLRVLDIDRELRVGDLARYVAAVEMPLFPWLPKDPRVLFSREWAAKGLWENLRFAEAPDPAQVPQAVLVGQEAFARRGLYPGALLRLTAYSPRTQAPRTQPFIVAGYFKTGLYEVDSMTILMERSVAKGFLGLELDGGQEAASGVRISLDSSVDSGDGLKLAQERVRAALDEAGVPFVRVLTWRDEKASLLAAVRMEKGIMFVILGVIILFGGLMMFIILTLLVVEKTRDLGVLQSLGATPGAVASIFFRIGALLCVSGMLTGTLHGVAFACSVNTIQRWIKLLTGWEIFPPSVYYIERIPVRFQPWDLFLIVVPTVLVSLIASSIPALRAARRDPAVALRYE